MLKRKISGVEFDVYSPSYYKFNELEVVYLGPSHGWRRHDGGYIDPMPYASKEAAVMRHIMAMQNFG